MNKKLRQRILNKLAQTQTAQPTETPKVLPPPPAVPAVLSSYLNKVYNGATVTTLKSLTQLLNDAMHYASNGQDSMQKLVNNTATQAGSPDSKNVNAVARKLYETFLNNGQDFTRGRVQANQMHHWADEILNLPQYNELSKINPTGPMATKLQVNLKSRILDTMNYLKQVNPIQ